MHPIPSSAKFALFLLLSCLGGQQLLAQCYFRERPPVRVQAGARQFYKGGHCDGEDPVFGLCSGDPEDPRWRLWCRRDRCNAQGGWEGGGCINGGSTNSVGWRTHNYVALQDDYGANTNIWQRFDTRLEGWEDDGPDGVQFCGGGSCTRNGCDDEEQGPVTVQNNRTLHRGRWTYFDASSGARWTGRPNTWVGTRPISRMFFRDGNTSSDVIDLGTIGTGYWVQQVNGNGSENFAGRGRPYTNTIGNSSADVWYRFTVTHCSDIRIETDNNRTDFDTYLRLYNSSLSQIDFDDDGGTNTTSRIRREIPPGTYYVVVEGFGGDNGGYMLEIYNYSDVSRGPVSWTGNVNRDWRVNGNWGWGCNTIPGEQTEVVIPNRSNDPIIYTGTNARCYDIEVQSSSGARVEIQNNANLRVYR